MQRFYEWLDKTKDVWYRPKGDYYYYGGDDAGIPHEMVTDYMVEYISNHKRWPEQIKMAYRTFYDLEEWVYRLIDRFQLSVWAKDRYKELSEIIIELDK